MGEVAEDMLDGTCCCLCGIYFVATHGYPVVCEDCWDGMSPKDRKMYQKATEEEL